MYVPYSSLEQFAQTTISNIIYLILRKTTQKQRHANLYFSIHLFRTFCPGTPNNTVPQGFKAYILDGERTVSTAHYSVYTFVI